ncbi:conserved hypothetical protein [Uncinocarpus reesii 1704]|uniref:DUF455 domain protein n=1 Tax=Uncinocarpus reesii (strain UAMH 1704) TaxID=336963 RepID=C4JH42_UNCRE|nr:uncharacterized protein UREG_01293 [Uncinocarpus reesii 1704]EEP76444.1 conserved hypothetical protein [Uncinocarpus reesii 1704]
MPFPIWCSTCQPPDSVLIGQGVRFNAEKKKVGNYYSTPIYSFRMKHGACGGWIEIRTDPKNTEYVVTEGARKKITSEFGKGDYEEDGVAEIRVKLPGEEGDVEDPLARLEGKVADKTKYMSAQTRMEELLKKQARDWDDPYEQSRKLRRTFRAERRGREAMEKKAEVLKDKMSLGIDLVEESEADNVRAGMVDFGSSASESVNGFPARTRTRPLFDSGQPTTSETSSSSASRRRPGKRVSKRKAAAEIASKRKAILQQEIKGNTKATIDPFLNDVNEIWLPDIRKRRKADLRPRGAQKDVDEDSPAIDDRGTDNIRDIEDRKQVAKSTENEQGKGVLSLVHYDSDTD